MFNDNDRSADSKAVGTFMEPMYHSSVHYDPFHAQFDNALIFSFAT